MYLVPQSDLKDPEWPTFEFYNNVNLHGTTSTYKGKHI